jgi:hypothetical protein
MTDPGARQRTRITVPRVDFDLSALAIGMLGYFAYQLSWRLLAPLLQFDDAYPIRVPLGGRPVDAEVPGFEVLRRACFEKLINFVRIPYFDTLMLELGWAPGQWFARTPEGQPPMPFGVEVPWWNYAVVAVAMLLIWSVVGGALSRVHAVRIARDRSITWDDGFAFSLSNLGAFVKAPLFVLLAAALFVGLDAAAGAVIAIPWAGAILQVVLHPLAMLAGLIVTIIALGGVFGYPLLQSAIAVERNGTLDAVSRTYSYAFTRPVMYTASGALVLAVGAIISMLGAWFMNYAAMGGMALGASYSDETVQALGVGYAAASNFGVPRVPDGMSTPGVISVWVSYVWSGIWWLAVRGFVLSYVVGGLTDLYFLLREEVDGTPTTEIWLDDEPELDLGEPLDGQPEPAPADAPPASE